MARGGYRKIVLTVVGVALAALAVNGLEIPVVAAVESGQAAGVDERSRQAPGAESPAADSAARQRRASSPRRGGATSPELRQPTSTLPVRWRVPFARHISTGSAGQDECGTAISVVNVGPADAVVDVEFFGFQGGSQGLASRTIPSGEPDLFFTDDDVEFSPFVPDSLIGTPNFDGFALVFADDPRVLVGAYLVCHEEGTSAEFPAVITNLSAFPVGQTLSFFQAGVPGAAPLAPTPPVTEPES